MLAASGRVNPYGEWMTKLQGSGGAFGQHWVGVERYALCLVTPCPRCTQDRVGSFRFCRSCGYDFESPPAPDHPLRGTFVPFDLPDDPDAAPPPAPNRGVPVNLGIAALLAVGAVAAVAVYVATQILG